MIRNTILCLLIGFFMIAPLEAGEKMLRHVVMFKFKEDADKASIKNVEEAFIGLKAKINVIQEFEWGTFVPGENLNKGFTHCFFVTFKSKKDLDDVYIPHKDHKAFVALLKPILADVMVFDYWADK